MSSGQDNPPEAPRRVAVVAIHGVADQVRNNTVRNVADLLMGLEPEQPGPGGNPPPRYTPFTEYALRIAESPLKALPTPPTPDPGPSKNPFEERPAFIRRRLRDAGETPSGETLDCEFTDSLLHGFQRWEKEEVYETVRLEGRRNASVASNTSPIDVHLFEMYWDDLSRLGSGFLRIFSGLYQLLFHLGSLGRQCLDLARIRYGNRGWWKWFGHAHAGAHWALTIPIPVVNLYLLAVVLTALADVVPPARRPATALCVAAATMGIGTAALLANALFRDARPEARAHRLLWWLSPFAAMVMGVLGALLVSGSANYLYNGSYDSLLALEWWLLLVAGILFLMRSYNRRRPGALLFTVLLGALIVPRHAYALLSAPYLSHVPVTAAFRTAAEVRLLQSGGWYVFMLFALATWLLGAAAVSTVRLSPRYTGYENDQAARAAFTARLSLALPAALFTVFTLMLWSGAARLGTQILRGAEDQIKKMLTASVADTFVIALVLMAMSVLLAVWALAPSIGDELNPPGKRENNNALSQAQGRWLSSGYALLRVAGELIFWTVVVLLPLGAAGVLDFIIKNTLGATVIALILTALMAIPLAVAEVRASDNSQSALPFDWTRWPLPLRVLLHFVLWAAILPGPVLLVFFAPREWTGQLPAATGQTLLVIGGLVAGSAVGFVAFRGKLDEVATHLRSVVDVALDVDNHLQELPAHAAPRARILSRCAAVLRHVCSPPGGQAPYDVVIIVAHSQGSVITADLLRYLRYRHRQGRPVEGLEKLPPVYLFTVGCPLRQLYSLRFPHLYEWARHDNRGEPEQRRPEPGELGIELWINGYRSGDYVGRYLWRADENEDPWQYPTIETDLGGLRVEFCIGAGAHTHYFDRTATDIGVVLDSLILGADPHPPKGDGAPPVE